jgi:malonate-semialdehyde dehydrogenase (acetylating)/methylmalonate-semialdehyde dehydrogenase
MAATALQPCPVFIDGRWREIRDLTTSPVYNPSRGEVISEVPMCGAEMVDQAVNAAAEAFSAWRDTPPVERARVLFRYRQLVEENFDRICQMVTREHGKTLAEARGSVYRGLENIEYACGIPTLLMGDTLENIARGVDCETLLQPLGVCVGITPFNFPAMVPMWMFPLALACGNTFVLKPSEKVPLLRSISSNCSKKRGYPRAC